MMILKDNVRQENAPSQVGWQAAMPTVSAGYIFHHLLQFCSIKVPGCQSKLQIVMTSKKNCGQFQVPGILRNKRSNGQLIWKPHGPITKNGLKLDNVSLNE